MARSTLQLLNSLLILGGDFYITSSVSRIQMPELKSTATLASTMQNTSSFLPRRYSLVGMATVNEQWEGQLCKELQFPSDQGRGYGHNRSYEDLTQKEHCNLYGCEQMAATVPVMSRLVRAKHNCLCQRHLSCCSLTNSAGPSDSWSLKGTEEKQAKPTCTL